ncbi:MAG: polyketide cyclase [Desulfuromonadales bacterium GWD2_61_12]|nr:MAG: polyketide cyclase [Desulfuromonadales bacterium GWC2_61_20]OGR33310.1 MAG: polyketide cyclase [Desulfuromonadales bacterium GWD2_61_12]HAD04918.1 polyketide cyclase [Desulfuromonas sp.]HBT83221.1 polyketide cyclase [Desulfuromonas sp.]
MLIALATIGVILIAAFLSYVATRPDSFRIERVTNINAPPEKIFPLIDNFQQWEDWSPWEKVDPNLLRSYSGAASGKGAVYVWQGNREVGVGRMEIVESAPPSLVLIKIDFEEPMTAHNTIKFELERQDTTTRVTQAMYGPSPFLSKLFGIFCNMEQMVGGKFEEGLASLKALAEKPV